MKNDLEKYFNRKSVQKYDAYIAPALIYPVTPTMVDLAQLTQGDTILDAACDSVIIAHYVAPRWVLRARCWN